MDYLVIGLLSYAIGFCLGSFLTYRWIWQHAAKYYQGYRDEDVCTIERARQARADDRDTIEKIRGRIIWLEASIKEAKDLIRDSELSVVMAKERLEKSEEDK